MKKFLIFFVIYVLALNANAYVVVDGLRYDLNSSAKTASLVGYSSSPSGDVTIPASFTYGNIKYVVTSIGERAFSGTSITSVNIPSLVTSIGYEAFFECCGLTSITIPASVTDIDQKAFACCESLTSMTVEDGNTVYDSRDDCNAIILTEEDQLIAGCSTTIIPNTVVNIGPYAFYDMYENLTSIVIPAPVRRIEQEAFANCQQLASVTLPNTLQFIGTNAFSQCVSLKSLTLPSSLTTISPYAFSSCQQLTAVAIPDKITKIENGIFTGCPKLASITIPNTVTSIGSSAFSGAAISTLAIPSSVTTIGENAFANCKSISVIVCEPETVPTAATSSFYADTYENATLEVPSSAYTTYKTTQPWSDFRIILKIGGSDTPVRCASPVISYVNDTIRFSCETEGAAIHYSIIPNMSTNGIIAQGETVAVNSSFVISCYATKTDYQDSETVTKTVTLAPNDLNGDNKVDASDVATFVKKLLLKVNNAQDDN